MSKQFTFVYQCPPIGLLPAAADAAGRTGPYKSLRNCSGKVRVACHVNQGSATQVTFSILQATSSGGAGSKAISVAPIFFNSNTTTGDALTVQTPAVNFQTDAGTNDKIVVFEFDPADVLDLPNGFNHIAVQTSASSASNITSADMEYLGRYQQQVPPASEV